MRFRSVDRIKYLAFEGGGGKAIVYLGALRVLQTLKLLPYRPGGTEPRLSGVAGSSGGAITAFFIALGLDCDEISDVTSTSDLNNQLLDPPEGGLYKAVRYQPSEEAGDGASPLGRNRAGYNIVRPQLGPGHETYELNDALKLSFRENLEEAREKGAQIVGLRHRRFPGLTLFLKSIGALIARLQKRKRATPIEDKLLNGPPAKTIRYFQSLLYDRGFFIGIGARNYFAGQLKLWAEKRYSTQLTDEEARNFTFHQFGEISGGFDLRVISTNVTLGKPKIFSGKHTPDFPLVDAICMSMAIPGAFRPTFVDAIVDLEKMQSGRKEDVAYLRDYMGFFADGGTTTNFPLHAFDEVDHPLAESLNEEVLGVRCTGGPDDVFLEEPETDDLYKRYQSLKPPVVRAEIPKVRYRGQGNDLSLTYTYNANGALSVVVDMAANLYDSVMYYSELGQIRSSAELQQVIELFSYDVGLFDFDLSKERHLVCLSLFVQRLAAVKLAVGLGIFGKEIDTYAAIQVANHPAALKDKDPASLSDAQRVSLMLFERYDVSRAPAAIGG
ncbi:MAG: hypothetical protein QOF63_538 [Thermoanaerobaculia bacterium]|nr:hypothetical protein [Thermoanaerobaculia bacterium]